MKRSVDQDQKGAEDDGKDPALEEDPVQRDLLENMGQKGLEEGWA